MSEPVLDVRDLRVAFGRRASNAVPVLHGVDLHVAPGECLAVVGASGAGKSVLARSLLGLAGEGGAPGIVTSERLRIAGTELRTASERSWRQVRGAKLGLVLQDALGSLDPLRTIGAEVAEPLRLHRRTLPRASAAVAGSRTGSESERVRHVLTEVGLDDPDLRVRQLPGELSGGMRQRALLATALVTSPPLLVLDEPTTALDATVAVGVLDLLARLRDEGTALLLITHDLGAVARLADRVVVLAEGKVVEQGPTARVLASPQHDATRALIDALPTGPRTKPTAAGADVVLEASGLTRRYPTPGVSVTALADVDLLLHSGEALGIVGGSGSGKSTLARLLVAAEPADHGRINLRGQPWSTLTERARRERRTQIRLVPQDPLGSMDPRRPVGRILRDAGAADDAAVARLLTSVHLSPTTATRMPRSLSGGQRQRVAIARALASDAEILVLDEPVSALDVQVQAGILDLLGELQATRGVALVLISHDLAVVRRVCDTVAVMSRGRIVERGQVEAVWSAPRHAVTKELLAAALTPTDLPPR